MIFSILFPVNGILAFHALGDNLHEKSKSVFFFFFLAGGGRAGGWIRKNMPSTVKDFVDFVRPYTALPSTPPQPSPFPTRSKKCYSTMFLAGLLEQSELSN